MGKEKAAARRKVLLTCLLFSASQNNIQESRLSTLLVSPQMSDGSEQAPQDSGSVSLWRRLLPQEGQMVSSLEEVGVGWGQVGDEGGNEGAGRLAKFLPPLFWLPPPSWASAEIPQWA